jgi:hypothetical protein
VAFALALIRLLWLRYVVVPRGLMPGSAQHRIDR